MNVPRRRWLVAMGAAACSIAAPFQVSRASSVTRMLVGFAPGGAADLVARTMAESLTPAGYSVIVDNRAGAGGRIAVDTLLMNKPDPDLLLFTPSTNLTLFPHLYSSIRYTPADFAPLGTACSFDFGMAVGASSPAHTLQDYLRLAKSNPAMASFGTPGAGTVMQFLGMMLAKDANVPLTHVPYKGGAPALTDTISGVLPALITTLPNLIPMHLAGKIRIIATSGQQPMPKLPGVQTFAQAGYPGLTLAEYFAVFARRGIDGRKAQALASAMVKAVDNPAYAQTMDRLYFRAETERPADLAQRLAREYAFWGKVVKQTGYHS